MSLLQIVVIITKTESKIKTIISLYFRNLR